MRKQEAAHNKNATKWGRGKKWMHEPWYLQFQLCCHTSLNNCNTDSKETRGTLCHVQLWSGEERQEMKSISCNAKNAAKLMDPSNTTVKESLGFSCSDSVLRQQEKGVHPAKLRQAGNTMRTWEAALFPEIIPHLTQNSPARQSKTLPEPEILSESIQELLPPINAFQWIPIRGEGQKIMSSMKEVFSDSWPGALRWKRNCTLLPWFHGRG